MGKKILVVDDEIHIVQIVKFNLEKRGGYEVLTAKNGEELEELDIEDIEDETNILDDEDSDSDGISDLFNPDADSEIFNDDDDDEDDEFSEEFILDIMENLS